MENIIEIKSGDYSAKINLLRGANCIELRNRKYNANILRVPDYTKELDNPYLYGMPILYPANRIENGKFIFENREYSFPINEKGTNCHLHGTMHNMEFEALKRGDSFVKCVFDRPYLDFLHHFRIEITYSLSDDYGLLQETEVINLSNENMPIFLGFHTTFNLPFAEGSKATDIRVCAQLGEEIERNMSNYLPTGRISADDKITEQFAKGTFNPCENKISRHYKADGEGIIELIDTKANLKVAYINDEKFKFRLFLTKMQMTIFALSL